MKSVIFLIITYFIIGLEVMACASAPPPMPEPPPVPAPPAAAPCSDQLLLLDEDKLKQGSSCPYNTRLVFPSYYQQGKVLILCQCK